MRSPRNALSIGAVAALLAGCGVLPLSQPALSGVEGKGQDDMQRTIGIRGGSWMLPGAKSKNLLYISDNYSANVYVLSYPGGHLAGTLTGFSANPRGLCIDRLGNVFVTDQAAIIEYAHGGTKPLRTLNDGEYPIACAVDPITGNLAVANESGSVSVYPNATGPPTTYSVSLIPLFCAYDDAGNLFVDSSGAPAIRIAKLPRGGNAFEMLSYDERNNGEPAGLAWVGKRLQVGSASPYSGGCCGRIYHVVVNGTRGRRAGRMFLRGALDNFFVEGTTAIVATNTDEVAFYAYPKGGHATEIIKEPGYGSYGVVVSLALH